MLFSVVMGVGINFKPRESRMICSSVSCSFDRFLMCFCVTQLCCCNAFSLCFYCVLFSFSWKPFYLLLFPLFLKTQIINGDKIHIVYSQERFWLPSKLRQVRWSWLLEFLLAYLHHYFVHCDDRVNKANIFFLRFTSPRFTSSRFTSPRFISPRFISPRFISPRFTSPVQSSPSNTVCQP